MQHWTIKQLKFADEVCFPEDFLNFMIEYLDDECAARLHLSDFKNKGGLIPWIFMYSRADMNRCMGETIDALIGKMVDGYE